jgi:hypothetical protein
MSTCICALWCDSCEGYREGFFELAKDFPRALPLARHRGRRRRRSATARWRNFPTILVERGGAELFYGPLLPHHEHLRRLLQSFMENPEKS